MFFAALTLIVVLALAFLYIERKRKFSLLKNLGIPGPPPNLLTGNLSEILEKGITVAADLWTKKYGDVVGFYNGSTAFVMVSDPDLAKRILLEDSAQFHGRGMVVASVAFHPVVSHNIAYVSGEQWSNMRSIVTPAFKPACLKELFQLMTQCVDDMVASLQDAADTGTTVNVGEPFERLTIDVILRCVMGVQSDLQKGGTNDEQALLNRVATHRTAVILGKYRLLLNSFAEFPNFWRMVSAIRNALVRTPTTTLLDYIKTVIEIRRSKHKGGGRNALELMLNAELSLPTRQPRLKTKNGATKTEDASPRSKTSETEFTAVDTLGNCIMLLVAGFETTANALQYTAYLLGKYPAAQERIRDEVTSALKKHGEFDYENIWGMQYLDQFITESLRMFPPTVGFTTREAAKDYRHQGLTIPRGTCVIIPTFQMQRNPNFWTDPDKFDPERFSPENRDSINPMAYQPFGHGPRKCIGERFAMLELKLTVAKLLSKYRLFLDEDHHKGDLEVKSWFVLTYPEGGVWIKFRNI